jgi:GNAT superfamily N-acetyltransferase
VISIRRAQADDAREIGGVFDAAVREGWTYLKELSSKPMFTPDDWDELVRDHAPPNVLLVAVDNQGRLAGFAAAHPLQSELLLLFVHPDYWGQGVARILLDASHDSLREAGCCEVILYTNEQNERSLAVYHAAGYHHDGFVRESEFRGVLLREPRLVKRL